MGFFYLFIKRECHGANCLQANGAERRKNDRLKKEKERERNLVSQGVTVIYIMRGGAPA